jgi:AcrR family transcriptional regulator
MTIALRHARSGKITPRWPARSDSKARFQLLIPAIETLLLQHDPSDITIQMIADEARTPPATVYHFFPSIDAAMFAQARLYLDRFVAIVENEPLSDDYTCWQKSWLAAAQRWRQYYVSNTACMRLLLGPDVPRDIQTMDSEFNIRLGRIAAARLHRYFLMPQIDNLEAICTNAVEIIDAFWRMSFERHATVSDAHFDESMRAAIAYLRIYVPDVLPPRQT